MNSGVSLALDSREVQTAEAAARAGGAVSARYFLQGLPARTKDVANLVTDADLEAERAVVEAIAAAFPQHAILGEEEHTADVEAEHLWIVDPLDGTTNFAHNLPHFSVSVAYYHRGLAQCGVVLNPVRGDLFVAVRGGGAWCNGRRARVTPHRQLSETLVGVGFYYDRGQMMEATLAAVGDLFRAQIHGIRRFGSAALDLCQVGAGMFGAFFEYELAPWDFGAGRLFVEEAGGRISDCLGGPLSLQRTSVLASNGLLHDETLEIVRRHYPAEHLKKLRG